MSNHNKPQSDVALGSFLNVWHAPLESVGMTNVQIPIRIQDQLVAATATTEVSLIQPAARGIHMSRLFSCLNDLHHKNLSWEHLIENARSGLKSQGELSDRAELSLQWSHLCERQALVSNTSGWRSYPIELQIAVTPNTVETTMILKVLYSSTCPCSEGLSRQEFRQQFDNSSIVTWLESQKALPATPHAQRSEAVVALKVDPLRVSVDPTPWIDVIENALGTPVQASVKREDELEFARLNAQNLMFCEDAARRLKAAFEPVIGVTDFKIEVRHFESLHAHDVIARAKKTNF